MKKAGSQSGRRSQRPEDVDSYLARLPKEMRQALEKLRRTIRAAAPDAEETISYQMPAYKLNGVLVFFAAFRNHLSFFPASHSIPKLFARELRPFEVSGTTIHFTAEHPLPASLIRRIVKARIRENLGRTRSAPRRRQPGGKTGQPARKK